MSIPVSIDPLGTLGAELPWVQPILTDWGSLARGLVVTNDPSQYYRSDSSRAMWKIFDDSTDTYWCGQDWPAVNNALFATATPIKVLSLVFLARSANSSNSSAWSFFARVNNDWVQLCAGDSYTDGLEKEYIIANPVFSNEYRLEMTAAHGTSNTSHAYCKDLKLKAVYKP